MTNLDEALADATAEIAAEMQRRIESDLVQAFYSATIPDQPAEPLTFEKMKQIIDSLAPYKASPRWFARIPLTELEPLPDRSIRWPVWYGLPLIQPRFVINLQVDAPRWVRVPCLARGGRKMRRKVYRRVWM